MKEFIAIVATTGNVLDKYQDYDSEQECLDHVARTGGWVAPNPGGSSKHYWVIDGNAKTLGYDQDTQDSDAAMSDWLIAITRTDQDLPRAVEDIWDAGGSPNARTQKLLDDKKALRAQKP
jgi:hypothetical protein